MRFAICVSLVLAACGPALRQARMQDAEPPSERELTAAERVEFRRCSTNWKWLLPGMGQICLRENAEGIATMGTFLAEIGGAVAAHRAGSSAEGPLVALQDVYLYGLTKPAIEQQLALRLRYVPQETTAELLAAPFNGRVLSRVDVWLGTIVAAGLAVTLESLIGDLPQSHFGDDPVLFTHQFDPRVGYPLGTLAIAGTFEHVAVTEEALFRGLLQSSIARGCGEGCGHLWASVIFGAAHAGNLLVIKDPDERRRYLEAGLPFITLTGAYMGWAYRRSGYVLSTSVAIHFWYDFILGFADFLLEPQTSPIIGRITIPF